MQWLSFAIRHHCLASCHFMCLSLPPNLDHLTSQLSPQLCHLARLHRFLTHFELMALNQLLLVDCCLHSAISPSVVSVSPQVIVPSLIQIVATLIPLWFFCRLPPYCFQPLNYFTSSYICCIIKNICCSFNILSNEGCKTNGQNVAARMHFSLPSCGF